MQVSLFSCWQKFYSCCVEYYESGTRPIGLIVLAHELEGRSNVEDPQAVSKSVRKPFEFL